MDNSLLKHVIRKCFIQLSENIQPRYICAHLYTNNALEEDDYLAILDSKESQQKTQQFLLKLPKKCTFEIFRDAISQNYDFLLKDLDQSRLEYVTSKKTSPEKPTIININTKARLVAVKQYYDIKRRHWNGDIAVFEHFISTTRQIYQSQIDDIKTCNDFHSKEFLNGLHYSLTKIADLYFKSMILKWRHEIGKTKPTIPRMQEIRAILHDIIPKTSVPALYNMSLCAQYALAMRSVGDLDEALRNVYTAKQVGVAIPNCREKVSILSTESNAEWERSARKGWIDSTEKERLIGLVKESRLANRELNSTNPTADSDDETRAAQDFDNATIIVEALIRVGIDDKGKNLPEVDVTETDLEEADRCLVHIEQKRNWHKLADRWKIIFFLAKAKMSHFQNVSTDTNMYIKCAIEHTAKVPYLSEIKRNADNFQL
ncbi:uncharacterized protein LOC132544549 [Ylistrum balloti]|uniref:uncharacterized protein LOC132544549 n=1 Tax=Ylistrum balloti TaxID=509963 RepID=UPI002905E2F7|nr:uncharacterized protein LOC132544549 [Ylistrum balloti]